MVTVIFLRGKISETFLNTFKNFNALLHLALVFDSLLYIDNNFDLLLKAGYLFFKIDCIILL